MTMKAFSLYRNNLLYTSAEMIMDGSRGKSGLASNWKYEQSSFLKEDRLEVLRPNGYPFSNR